MTHQGGMTRKQIEAFLGEPRNAVIAAIRKDGRPQMTPHWFHWDDERFYITTTKTRRKYGNLKRDPRVQLAIDDPTGFRAVLIDGTVELVEDVHAVLDQYKTLREKHGLPVGDDGRLVKGLEREERVMMVVTPDKPLEEWTSWGPPE